jgi:hypothetical protein
MPQPTGQAVFPPNVVVPKNIPLPLIKPGYGFDPSVPPPKLCSVVSVWEWAAQIGSAAPAAIAAMASILAPDILTPLGTVAEIAN